MANDEHLEIISQGVEAWNKWREENVGLIPKLQGANLCGANLSGMNLINVSFYYADLSNSDLRDASLRHAALVDAKVTSANLSNADVSYANLHGADLTDATLVETDFAYSDLSEVSFVNSVVSSANFKWANLKNSDLTGADFRNAYLRGANLSHANVRDTNFTGATFGWTDLGNLDLSEAVGLEKVEALGPCSVGIDTIYRSKGKIPEAFLRGAGVPDHFITYMNSLIEDPVEFYSCFISYSHKDEEFAMRLCSRMRDENLRVWFAPEDLRSGRKLNEQIDEAIKLYDRLLIVLSDNSMSSAWVITEIHKAKQRETNEGNRVLFPIRLVDFESIKNWECFDSDSGRDLAREIREYYVPDFQDWKNHDSFEATFERLLRDLKAE